MGYSAVSATQLLSPQLTGSCENCQCMHQLDAAGLSATFLGEIVVSKLPAPSELHPLSYLTVILTHVLRDKYEMWDWDVTFMATYD